MPVYTDANHGYLLRIDGIRKSYLVKDKPLPVLSDISLSIKRGEIVAFVGESGCGKSTLLKVICGLLSADSGGIEIAEGGEESIGYMPQRDHLLPWLSIVDNVALPLIIHGAKRKEARRRAGLLLTDIGLADSLRHYPYILSGGMRQRVAFLRAVILERDILLLDEPFSSLDALTRLRMQDWLLAMHRMHHWTMLLVTHNIDEAIYLADRVAVLAPRPTRIRAQFAIDIDRPRNSRIIASPSFGKSAVAIRECLEGER